MRKTDLEDLRNVLQRLRAERYPQIDPNLVDTILETEAASTEDEVVALQLLRKTIDQALDNEGTA